MSAELSTGGVLAARLASGPLDSQPIQRDARRGPPIRTPADSVPRTCPEIGSTAVGNGRQTHSHNAIQALGSISQAGSAPPGDGGRLGRGAAVTRTSFDSNPDSNAARRCADRSERRRPFHAQDGPVRTAKTPRMVLRIRRLGVRIPPGAPAFHPVIGTPSRRVDPPQAPIKRTQVTHLGPWCIGSRRPEPASVGRPPELDRSSSASPSPQLEGRRPIPLNRPRLRTPRHGR